MVKAQLLKILLPKHGSTLSTSLKKTTDTKLHLPLLSLKINQLK